MSTTGRWFRGVLGLFLVSLAVAATPGAAEDTVIAIKAARLLDGTGRPMISNGVVVVRSERIEAVGSQGTVAVPANAEVIDLGNETLLPGLIDAHAHLSIRPDFRSIEGQLEGMAQPDGKQMLRAVRNVRVQLLSGVTALYVVGEVHYNDVHFAAAVKSGLVPGPRIYPSGNFITTTSGHGPTEYRNADGPEAIVKFVRQNLENGAHHMKLTITNVERVGPNAGSPYAPGESNFTLEEVRAAVNELHRHGRRATAHANGDSILLALRGGVDLIQHGYDLTDEIIDMLAQKKTPVVNTYTVRYQTSFQYQDWDFLDHQARNIKDWIDHCRALLTQVRRQDSPREAAVQKRFQELRKAAQKGVPLAVGTDSMQGLLPLEIENLVEAGFTPLQAITAATGVAGSATGLGDQIGTLEKGKLADLISVKGDPLSNIHELSNVHFVMVGGRRYDDLSFR